MAGARRALRSLRWQQAHGSTASRRVLTGPFGVLGGLRALAGFEVVGLARAPSSSVISRVLATE
jgi:hypothetical protein